MDVKQLLSEIENVSTVSRNRFSTHLPALLFLLTDLMSVGAMRSEASVSRLSRSLFRRLIKLDKDFISHFISVFCYLMLTYLIKKMYLMFPGVAGSAHCSLKN